MENKRISVLLIEDSIDDAELIRRTLEKSASTKFQVTITHKLEDGLKQAETNEPDLIVSDLGLPDSHGLDTVTKILLALPHVPLVVLSGFDDEETGIKAVQSGAQDYLVKGRLDETQLERSIYYSIERARLQYELEQNSQEISKLHTNLLKILENSTDATVVVDENGGILFSNPAVESLFGQKPKELLNQSFQYPLVGGKTSEIEIYRTDGKKNIAEMNVVNISWEGKPASLVSMHNITKRKSMEEALRASEEKYRNIVEQSNEGIIITNLQGIITSCNVTFLGMIGLPQEEVVGKHFKDISNVNIKELPTYIKMFASLLLGKKNPPLEIPWKVTDGTTRIFELKSNLMKSNGDIFGVQTIVTDITERKQMEQALKESEEKFSKAFHNLPETVSIARMKDSIFIDVNDSFCRFNRYTREEVIGHKGSELDLSVKSSQWDQVLKMLKERGRAENVELEFKDKSGDTRTQLFSAEIINIGGEPCLLAIANDISQRKQMEQALKESEDKFSKAFHNLPESVSISRLKDSVFIDVNESFCRNNGYTSEEVIGHKGSELNLSIEPSQWSQVREMVKERGRAENIEIEFKDKSGKTRTQLFSAEIINLGGEPCLLTIANDISQRKQMERAMRESEEKFSKAFLNSPESIVISDIDNGTIIEANDTFLRFSGYTREGIIGKKANELQTWANLEERAEAIKILKKDGVVRNRECHFHTKTGETGTWLFSAEIINIGDRPYMLSVTTDITERKQIEEDLKQSEEKYRELINTSTDAIISADPKMRVTIWNHGAEKIFGYKESEMIGQSVLKIVPEAHRKGMFDGFIYLNKTGSNAVSDKILETIAIRKNGTQVPIELSISTRKAGDTFIATAIIRDITARKEAEEKLRKIDQMKSEFLSNVSHELRTPLQSISGFTKLIMAGKVPDPATQQEFLQIIDGETTHLGNLINSLLDMSRLESGRFQIYTKNVSMHDIIADCMKTLHGLSREKNIILTESVPKQLPEMEADNERIRQVILNLVGNAIKFSDRGASINVKVTVKNSELLFQIIDHGIGIKKEAIPHLFERFYRAEGETVRGGTGLGLYISKQIIDAHRGQIWVESKYGVGSTFSFTLPFNGKGGEKHGKEDSDNRRRPGNTKTGRLLTKAGGVSDNHGI